MSIYLRRWSPVPFVVLFALTCTYSSSALAAKVNYSSIFNNASNVYIGMLSLSSAHNKYLHAHQNMCGSLASSKQGKAWLATDTQDGHKVASTQKQLQMATRNQRKKATYKDLNATLKSLNHWNQTMVRPRLVSCKKMPTDNSYIDQELSKVQSDIQGGSYG